MKIVYLFLVLTTQALSAQLPYQAGYQSIAMTDTERIYKPGTRMGDALHYRPLEIDLWYPAVAAERPATSADRPAADAPAIPFGDFIRLLEQRADRFQDDTVYTGFTSDLVRDLCANLRIADTTRFLNYRTTSYRNAPPQNGRFPLLIYLCSYNGICFENIPLFETLARHGYIVASITSVGRYPGNMSTKPADLFEQVSDGLYAMKALSTQPNVDPGKIGLIGYSWGGLAAVAMAMNDDSIGAVLSLDGSELHYYGESADEDSDFDELRHSPWFHPHDWHVPYGYLESGGKQEDRPVDSIFGLLGPRSFYRRFPKATHEDFSCLPALASRLLKITPASPEVSFDSLACWFFDRYLQHNPTTRPAPQWTAGTDSTYPQPRPIPPTITITGKVFDRKDKTPLPYVNIGIPGKNVGTVSGQDGSFLLKTSTDQVRDSIRFSMAGYLSQTIAIADWRRHTDSAVFLKQNITELRTVTLSTRRLHIRRIGNTSRSTFMSVGFPLRTPGTEMGVKMDLGRTPIRLRRFNFDLSASHLDTAIFRLNIHRFDQGQPGENLLHQNIIVSVGKKRGVYTIDLIPYSITLQGEVLVSLEWLGNPPDPATSPPQSGAVYFSAGFFNAATWRRETSQGSWKKARGIGIGFNLETQR